MLLLDCNPEVSFRPAGSSFQTRLLGNAGTDHWALPGLAWSELVVKGEISSLEGRGTGQR